MDENIEGPGAIGAMMLVLAGYVVLALMLAAVDVSIRGGCNDTWIDWSEPLHPEVWHTDGCIVSAE